MGTRWARRRGERGSWGAAVIGAVMLLALVPNAAPPPLCPAATPNPVPPGATPPTPRPAPMRRY